MTTLKEPSDELTLLANKLGQKVKVNNTEHSCHGRVGILVEIRAYTLTFGGLINYETCQVILEEETTERRFYACHLLPC